MRHLRGYRVGGSDRTETELTDRLSECGIEIFYSHDASHIEGYDAVVYTVAVSPDNPEYKAQFTSVSGAIKQIIKTNGILGCWQGFCTTLIRDTIGVSLYFGFYEIYRRALLKKDQVGAGRCVDA